MPLPIFRKSRYKNMRNIVLDIKNRVGRFWKIDINGAELHYPKIRNSAKKLAIFEARKQSIVTISSYFLLFVIAVFAISIPFYLPIRLGLNKPLITAFIYFIPSSIISLIFYLFTSYGNFRHIYNFTYLPLEDKLTNAFKWVFVSAIISGISTFLFSPLLIYLILTPFIVGVGSAIFYLAYEISFTYLLGYLSNRFNKKYPIASIIDLFLELLEDLENRHSGGLFHKSTTAQLFGELSNLMQDVLPKYFTRAETGFFISEINDPYINKLIERRVAEMAMTLKLYASKILVDDKNNYQYIEKKLTNSFFSILEGNWENYEIEKSDEIAALLNSPHLSRSLGKTFDKLKLATIGLFPALALLLVQNTKYALSDKIIESILPFILTWAFISILSLIGSDELIDRALKARSVLGILEKPLR